ncbi:hypothetical protein BJG93_27780 [Paraburkholderia sprentiae WSM5005]|uniref:Uncharacterized protein n=1 Tax=Paraburkholderia sprentiae WSM5005 TaxID=754502 RepID=A0A1I9YS53_9BURK|nr:hypothetical protein [Paraburkholderia sprentiae]APA89045.1 hypothetical protein BJG93_27780 [Paraburkholderia sprentiae WSM5005]
MIDANGSPQQAFAVFELLSDLRARIWIRYCVELHELIREQRYHPAMPTSTTAGAGSESVFLTSRAAMPAGHGRIVHSSLRHRLVSDLHCREQVLVRPLKTTSTTRRSCCKRDNGFLSSS